MFRTSFLNFQLLRVTPILFLHPKKTSRRPIRTKHSTRWWKQAKPSHLTARTLEETPDAPSSFSHFNEEVDRPFHHPKEPPTCFQCKKTVDLDVEHCASHIWIPSGNSKKPYFFHTGCFRCSDCGFRFYGSKFYSQKDKAVCVGCALGRTPKYPHRWWHSNHSCVTTGRAASRMAGHVWPRHQHQVEFLYDPDS